MAGLLGRALIELAANTASFQSDMSKAARIFDKRTREMQKSASTIEKSFALINKAAKPLIVLFAGLQLKQVAAEALASADQFAKLGLRLGETTENLSTLAYIGERAGIEFRGLGQSLQVQQRIIAEAAVGLGEGGRALEALGLSARELASQSVTDQFRTLAAAIYEIEDASIQTLIAQKIWQSEGVRNLQIVKQGTAAFDEAARKARDFGVELDTGLAKNAEAFNDALADTSDIIGRVGQNMFLWLAGPAATFLGWFNESLKNMRDWIKSFDRVNDRMNLQTLTLRADRLGEELRKTRELLDAANEIAKSNTGVGLTVALNDAEIKRLTKLQKELNDEYQETLTQINLITNPPLIKATQPGGTSGVAGDALQRYIDAIENSKKAEETFKKSTDGAKFFNEELKTAAEQSQKLGTLWDNLGFSFASAFENAVISGEKLRNVMQGLLDDITRLVLRQTVTTPIANAIGGALGAAFAPPSPGTLGRGAGQYFSTPNLGPGTTSGFAQAAVQVNNYTTAPAQVSTSQIGGRTVTDITVGNVAGDIRSGGQVAQALQQTFGLSRRGVLR